MSATPYADAAVDYHSRGWSPVPLPPGCKKPPPTGWTGYAAPYVSGADVHEWASNGYATANIGLRMPETVLGLDLDAYDGKPGLETMLAATDRLGPLPPSPRSSSRPDDPVSGIRFYRVPPRRRWADVLGPGVEVIHYGHRYACVAPSLHPEGRDYAWYAPGNTVIDSPAVDELPDLPAAWVADLDRGDIATRAEKADVLDADVATWLGELPTGDPCRYVSRLLVEAEGGLEVAASRHDTVRGYIGKMVRAGEQGHRGAVSGLNTLEAIWRTSLGRGKPREPDPGEWDRMVTGAVALVVKDPTSVFDKGCCPAEPPAPSPLPESTADDVTEAEFDAAAQFAREVAQEAYKIRVRDAAREKVAAEKAKAEPPFDAGTLAEVLARPAEPPHRIEGLVPSGASTLVVAQRKTGKTTLVLNLARCLTEGGEFLGTFATRPLQGRVAILNYEVSGQMLARWASEAGVPPDRLVLVNLRGRRNPLRVEEDRVKLASLLRSHDVEALVVDPFGRAYGGKSQNDAAEVGGWLVDLDVFARSEVGATDVYLCAHAGWTAERTRGSSALEDWPDVTITLTRDRDNPQVRYLAAEGRDVLLEEDRLDFNPAARQLTLSGSGSRRQAKAAEKTAELSTAVVEIVTERPGLNTRELADALRAAGHAFQRGDVGQAARNAATSGHIRQAHGPRNSILYYPKGAVVPSSPEPSQRDGLSSPDPSYRGRDYSEDHLTLSGPDTEREAG